MFRIALAAMVIGPVLAACTMLAPGRTRPALLFLAVSLALFGIGEVLNHPLQIERRFTEDGQAPQLSSRRRNPCLLGNLLVIGAILFLFMAFSQFISF